MNRPTSPVVSESGFGGPDTRARGGNYESETTRRAAGKQAALAKREPRSKIRGAGGIFSTYKSDGAAIAYSENKIGVMPNLAAVIEQIAANAGVTLSDSDVSGKFLEALVTDVYVNPYSDKQTFDGQIQVNGFTMDRVHIKLAIEPHVGSNHRRFARAMAQLVVEVMHDNYAVFGEILDKRMAELNLSSRAEAVKAFDGADALALDRESARHNAEAKALAIGYKAVQSDYRVENSAAADGLMRTKPVEQSY